MGRFYSLSVPSNIEGVNMTIDVSMGPINHIAFDGGMSRDKMYEVLANGSFGDTVVNLITDDINEFASSVKDGLGTTVIPYEICTVDKAVKVLSDMESRLNQRYNLLNSTNNKNIECYNDWANKHDKMKPVVICWIGADKILKQMGQEDIYDLIACFLKVGRAVGITLLLHSDELNGIKEALGTDMFACFTSIHVSEDKNADDVTIHFATAEYRAGTIIKDRM